MSNSPSRSSGGTDATDVAKQEGQRVKGTASDAASNVGDSAARQARDLKGQARQHARGVADDARRQLRGHAEEETRRAGEALGTAGTQLRALADGRVEEAGVLGDYVEAAADAVARWADTVQDRGLDGLLQDARSFGRRRPGMFLAGALVAGVVVGRFGRNAAQELGDDTSTSGTGRSPGGDRTSGASADEVPAAREPVGGGVGGAAPRGGQTSDDDLIVGYASDDRAVVSPEGTTADEVVEDDRPTTPPHRDDDPEYRPIDADQGRLR